MIVKCWGARGSIPVSGSEYIKYGGSTTCMEVRADGGYVIVIDAGSGIRKLGNRLHNEGVKDIHLIFTHAHWDHLLGFPFFKPVYFSGTNITMYGCSFAQESIKNMIAPTMTPPYFPVDFKELKAQISSHNLCSTPFLIGPVKITPILLSHPNQGIGFRFEEDGNSFVFLTDNELAYSHEGGLDFDEYVKFSKGANLLVHDAEFTESDYRITKGWGHSVYKDALRLAMEAGVERLGLFHHNQERSDKGVDDMVDDCRVIAAEKGSALDCFGLHEGWEIEI